MEEISVFNGIVIMVCTMFGSGVILLPKGYVAIGWLGGTLFFAFSLLITMLSLYFISMAAHRLKKKESTYYTCVVSIHYVFGILAEIAMIISGVLACVFYLKLVSKWTATSFFSASIEVYISIPAILLMTSLSFLKNLSKLKHMSYVSVGSVIYLMFLVLLYYVKLRLLGTNENKKSLGIKALNTNFSKSIGPFVFALCCQQNIVNVYNSLADKSIRSIFTISICAPLFGGSIYYIIGLVGYLLIGKNIESDILSTFIKKETGIGKEIVGLGRSYEVATTVAIVGFLMILTVGFAFQAQPTKISMRNMFYLITKIKRSEQMDNDLHYIITLLLSGIVYVGYIFRMNIDQIEKYCSSLSTLHISFTFPALVYITTKRKLSIMNCVAGVLAIFSLSMAVYMLIPDFNQHKR